MKTKKQVKPDNKKQSFYENSNDIAEDYAYENGLVFVAACDLQNIGSYNGKIHIHGIKQSGLDVKKDFGIGKLVEIFLRIVE